MITQNDILTAVIKIIESTDINLLSGGVYKKARPTDSELEDCVVSLIPGTVEKHIQDGSLHVKLFFTDILFDNTYYEDSANASSLELLLFGLSESLINSNIGLVFYKNTREIYTEPVEAIHQHFAILKINYEIV